MTGMPARIETRCLKEEVPQLPHLKESLTGCLKSLWGRRVFPKMCMVCALTHETQNEPPSAM